MFDASHRLVLCNSRYAQIYGLTQEQVARGTPLREIIEHRIRNGLLSDRTPEDIVTSMLRRRDAVNGEEIFSELSDGRRIAVTIQPMADGGTVTTRQDITERQKLIALLEQQNLRFDAALKNMSQGLCMFDAEQRLDVANDRYAEMYVSHPTKSNPERRVETQEQWHAVKSEGCTEMQGYLFSKPRSAEEIRQLFLSGPNRKNAMTKEDAA